MGSDTKLTTKSLVDLITKANAHVSFKQAITGIPFEQVGIKPQNLPYNIWMLVEHLRIAQADILDFSINPQYKELKWPEEYWPTNEVPANEGEWQKSLDQIRKDMNTFIDLLEAPNVDLYTPFAHGSGQNLIREALLIADHNSYHTGEIVLIRRLLGNWKS
jgi:hypothetical protein